MTYQVLARKWRPQGFAALIGQDSVKTALQNALEEGRVAQAYLFSGIRGVGKTTAARLFAKALNCEKGPAAEPCNECSTCRDITVGSDMDVIEVDAATYSKVEQIRELTESLRYGPARDRFKVVVIDEIHRLSRQAFDALLKIVEEPPAHLTFIFATTESESVPATILSRCQEYRFRRVSAETLSQYLREISEAEKIEVGDRALRLIARAGEGSVRDSVALLDQLATFGGGSIGDQDAVRLLGGLDAGLFHRLLTSMLAGAAAEVSAIVIEIEDNGWDPKGAFTQFLGYCRDALHLALGADRSQVDLPPDDIESLAGLAAGTGYENVLRLLNQLLASEQIVRKSEASSLALEISWLRAAELPKLQRLEELLGAGPASGGSAGSGSKGSGRTTSRQSKSARPPATASPPPGTEAADPLKAAVASVEGATEDDADQGGPSIEAFLDLIRRAKPSLRAHLDPARLAFQGRTLRVAAAPSDPLLRDALERNRALVDEAMASAWGKNYQWRIVEESPRPQAQAEEPEQATTAPTKRSASRRDPKRTGKPKASSVLPAADGSPRDKRATAPRSSAMPTTDSPHKLNAHQLAEVSKHPTVQAVLEVFGGTIQSIEPRSDSRADDPVIEDPEAPSEVHEAADPAPVSDPSQQLAQTEPVIHQEPAPKGRRSAQPTLGGTLLEAPKQPDVPVQRSRP